MRRMSFVSGFAVVLFAFMLASGAAAQVAPAAPAPAPSLAEVFAGESLLPQADLMPKPALKCGPICITALHFTTATISGSGPDCTSAQNSLNSQLQSIARGDCINNEGFLGSCNVVIHDTTSCTMIAPGTYQFQGYATYNCKDTTC